MAIIDLSRLLMRTGAGEPNSSIGVFLYSNNPKYGSRLSFFSLVRRFFSPVNCFFNELICLWVECTGGSVFEFPMFCE